MVDNNSKTHQRNNRIHGPCSNKVLEYSDQDTPIAMVLQICRKEMERKGKDVKRGSPGFLSVFKNANHVGHCMYTLQQIGYMYPVKYVVDTVK